MVGCQCVGRGPCWWVVCVGSRLCGSGRIGCGIPAVRCCAGVRCRVVPAVIGACVRSGHVPGRHLVYRVYLGRHRHVRWWGCRPLHRQGRVQGAGRMRRKEAAVMVCQHRKQRPSGTAGRGAFCEPHLGGWAIAKHLRTGLAAEKPPAASAAPPPSDGPWMPEHQPVISSPWHASSASLAQPAAPASARS